jgi:hypothetical protein
MLKTAANIWLYNFQTFQATKKKRLNFRILGSHSGGYEEFYLLGYNAIDFELTARHYIPEDSTLRNSRFENLKC